MNFWGASENEFWAVAHQSYSLHNEQVCKCVFFAPLAAQAGMFVSSPVLRVLREHWASPTKLKLNFETL